MSLGPVMLDLVGLELSPEEREILQHPLVGGVILFTRNYESPEQIERLVSEIHGVRQPPLLVAVDHEGGRVQRFRDGFTRLPAMRPIGERFAQDAAEGRRLAETMGWLMAAELRAVGVDFSFAPVLDLDYGVSEVIGDRAFARDPGVAADLANAFMQGMHRAGMAAVGKHFPGHGAVEADSHVALPVDRRDYDAIGEDIEPFARMVEHGLDGIMPAHVIYDQVDERAAGFSYFWIAEVLRQRLGFDGVVFSDDLNMAAAGVAGGFVERARAALAAGCDMILVCNNPQGAMEVLDGLGPVDNPMARQRLARMHGRQPNTRQALQSSADWWQAVGTAKALCSGA